MAIRHHIAHIEAYRCQPRAVEQFDPVLLAAGLEVPALSVKARTVMRRNATCYVATQSSKARPRSEAQKTHARYVLTVAGKAARQEVRDILARLGWLGAVRG